MFLEYIKLGIEHILDPNGLDHVLFLIALVILFSLKDWKDVIIMATAFTLGHSITLALSALNVINFPSNLIEILIAVSIALTALHNILKPNFSGALKLRYLTATFFGLIHGCGFAGFFRTILGKDDITIPLLGFNLGVEVAQLIVVVIVLLISYVIVNVIKIKKRHLIISTSCLILLYSLKLIVERI